MSLLLFLSLLLLMGLLLLLLLWLSFWLLLLLRLGEVLWWLWVCWRPLFFSGSLRLLVRGIVIVHHPRARRWSWCACGRRVTVENKVGDLEGELVAYLELEAMPTGRWRLLPLSSLLLSLWPVLRLWLHWHWLLLLFLLRSVLLVSPPSQLLLSYPLHQLPQPLLPLLLLFLLLLLLPLLCRLRPRG